MIEILLWVLSTLLLVSLCVVLAKKQGPEYIIGLFAALYVMANILVAKIVQIGPFSIGGGVIVFSLTFYLTDMLSEFYGKEEAKKAVWVGLLAQIILVVSVYIVMHWPAAPFWENQKAFETILGNTWRIVAASLITYVVSQHTDIFFYDFWKKKTKGRFLWIRNNGSTMVSQFIDTTLFVMLAFYGVFEVPALVNLIYGNYLVKLAIAALDTPFLYAVKWYFDR